jgi:hypothetical protein
VRIGNGEEALRVIFNNQQWKPINTQTEEVCTSFVVVLKSSRWVRKTLWTEETSPGLRHIICHALNTNVRTYIIEKIPGDHP